MKMKHAFTFLAVMMILFLAIVFVPKTLLLKESSNQTAAKPQRVEMSKETSSSVSSQKENSKEKTETLEEKAAKIVDSMTLEQKIGQLLMVGFKGVEKNEEIIDLISNKSVGGVILFDRNMETPEQVANLNNSLQKLAAKQPFSIPLLIGVDQEGGDILRMRDKVSPIPSQQELGQAENAQNVFEVAYLNGKELAAMGFNVNFAPVLDLSNTDSRSFGTDPEKVYHLGEKVVQGFNKANITATLKHFPGNGRSKVDPHLDTSSVKADQTDLENSDIYPFQKIIENVDNQSFFVMITHIKYPSYDSEKPASLSSVIMKKLLREKLDYTGIIVTDDLEMGAVNKYYSYEDMAKEAINAGADLLLVCHEYSHQVEVYNGLLKAAKKGEIPEERINEAATRLLTYKLTHIRDPIVDPQYAKETVGSEEHQKLIENSLKTRE